MENHNELPLGWVWRVWVQLVSRANSSLAVVHGVRARDGVALMLILGLSLSATIPLLFTSHAIDYSIDYDSTSLSKSAKGLLLQQQGYIPNRKPGSPVYELGVSFLMKIFSVAGIAEQSWDRILMWLSWFFSAGFLLMFYCDLRKYLSTSAASFACLCIALHPLLLWHGFSVADDVPALFFGYLSWRLIRADRSVYWAAVFMAVGVNCKGFALAYFMACLVYLCASRRWRQVLEYGLMSGALSFLLFLPALAGQQMDISRAFQPDHYGTSPETRPPTGWFLFRGTLFFQLPLMVFLFLSYLKRFISRKFGPGHPADLSLAVVSIWLLMDLYKLNYWILAAAVLLWQTLLLLKDSRTRDSFLTNVVPMVAVMMFVLKLVFVAPYSRSFILLALPALILLAAMRFKSTPVWAMAAAAAFLPMFFHYEVSLRPPFLKIKEHGFYYSLRYARANEYNDFGFNHVPNLFP